MRLAIAALLAATAAAAPALADTRDFPVGKFDRITTNGPWNVRVHTGRAPSVHADATRETLDRLTVEVVNGELRIGSKSVGWSGLWHWGSWKNTTIDVTVPMIDAVTLNGPGDLTVDRIRTPHFAARLSGPGNINLPAIETGHLDLDLSGPGDITLAGKAGDARVRLSGPGDIHGKGLTVGDVDVHLSGPGDITLNAFGNATGSLSGPGDITLTGHAKCSISKSGPGDVHC